ncbi:hypothetical protein [Cellulosimicrobium funkei]|uniref:hypothetical protein n=1 Tax=Cellulosimicrobium funkei TaxID=264251 RepID=UPI0036789368
MTPRTTAPPLPRPTADALPGRVPAGDPRRRSRAALVAAGAVGLALALTACSTSDAATPDPATSSSSAEDRAPDGAPEDALPGGGGRTPGVSGEVAAVDGTTAQVQDGESQTAVSWSDGTAVTVTVDGTLADVAVGTCVVALTGSPGGAPGDENDASDDTTDAAAATVSVSEPVDGECTGGLSGSFPGGGFPGGERPDGAPSDLPTDLPERPDGAPTDLPSGAPDGEARPGGFGGLTTGLVTAVDGTTITVTTTTPEGESDEEAVTVDDATAYTVQRTGSGDDVVVGQCVSAQGESGDDGTITATSLVLSAPGDDGCTPGFPGGRRGFSGGRDGDGQDRGQDGQGSGESDA